MDIKIDKIKYFTFLNSVKHFIETLNSDQLTKHQQNEIKSILEFVEKEQQLRILMEQQKLYYQFYITNKNRDPQNANDMYKKYLDVKMQIERIRREDTLWEILEKEK